MAKSNGSAVPEFMRQVVADEPPVSERVVAEHAVLALNASMMRFYEDSLATFKRNMRGRVPIILALFTGQGGQMILYRPGHGPEVAPPVPVVYQLAKWINRDREIIPRDTINKPPSAELKPNQRDQDTLPPYEILDPILQLYVEENLSVGEIVGRGFDEGTVRWVQRRVDLNEYKRAQAVPGLKVTSRAFGVGRRMPVAQRFVE